MWYSFYIKLHRPVLLRHSLPPVVLGLLLRIDLPLRNRIFRRLKLFFLVFRRLFSWFLVLLPSPRFFSPITL
ncbi:hypothetical protein WN66_01941 [Saccharomyces cerevisiae]|nr:hypothetical protein WN66_01941 [Saccharomyces cerevisiae]